MQKDTNEITKEIDREIEKLEAEMQSIDFWNDKNKAQATLKKLAELKEKKELIKQLMSIEKLNNTVTLVYSAKDEDHNNAVVLLEELINSKKASMRVLN